VISITIPGTVRSEPIELAFPSAEDDSNVINIICGQNNTGKSYALEGLRQCLQLRWVHTQKTLPHSKCNIIEMDLANGLHKGDIYVKMSFRSPQPSVLFLSGSSWKYMLNAGSIALTRNPKKLPTHEVSYAILFSLFVYEQIKPHIKQTEYPSEKDWLENDDARRQVLLNLTTNDILYKCKSKDDVVGLLETALGALLYFRYVKVGDDSLGQVDFCLVYGDGSSRVYTEWSDGQRAVFYFLTLIRQVSPDILLLDEIENHLHPAYISDVLSFLKRHVAQSIITTHHPHVVFSELVDKVIYLEALRPPSPATSASEVEYVKKQFQSSPQRKFFTLENSFEKVAAIYKLFARRDMQLLLQAQGILQESEMMFYSSINNIYRDDVKFASSRLTPDTQSIQLLNGLKKMGLFQQCRDRHVILDFGTGCGRTESEVSKLSSWQLGGRIEWICWERDPMTRQILREQFTTAGIKAIIPESIDDITNKSVDLCTFVNVIHHLTPENFAAIIETVIPKIVTGGALVILELHPLISAEKFAVPYSPDRLTSIFRKLGFLASYELTPVRDTSAYCLVVTGPSHRGLCLHNSTDEIREIIEEEWNLILEDAIHGYAQRQSVTDYRGLRDLLCSLTTIASICAWQQDIWK